MSDAFLEELAFYCKAYADVLDKYQGVRPFKGKEHIWVEKITTLEQEKLYVVYYFDKETKKWTVDTYDDGGRFLNKRTKEEPFDVRGE